MILDGVVDPTIWISYKVAFTPSMVGTSSHLWDQFLHSALVDTEKTYSGLTDGCAAAGKAGCKLIELTGDNASGDDVKTLLDNTHDVIDSLRRLGNLTDPVSILVGSPALSRWDRNSLPPWPSEGCGF